MSSITLANTAFATDPTLSVNIANSISLELKPTSAAGNFATSDTNTNTISVTTNYFAGYTLSIAASTANDNALKYVENGTTLATLPSHSISAGVSATNYADDTYAETNELNNTWGYRPSKYNSVDNTTTNYYYPGPTSTMNTAPTILDATSVANAGTANNYNIAIGARIDAGTPKGNYSNTFVIQVVANPIPYTITYNSNTTDTVTNMPSNVNTATMDTSVTLGGAPSRVGYNFVGWCTAAIVDGGTCASPNTQYAADGSYTINQVSGANNLVLYATWARWHMQEVDDWGNKLDEGDEVTVMDSRDHKTYTVAKLADGNIWMTQNLDFDIVDYGRGLDYTNTDVPEDWADAGDLENTYETDDDTWDIQSYTTPESYDPGDVCWLGEGEESYGTCGDDKHYHLGNYYNWTAAVAMSSSVGYETDGEVVDQSICPAGWTLPLGGDETGPKSFYNLVSQYDWDSSSKMMGGNYTMWGAPLYFPLSGAYWEYGIISVGADGFYWSSVVGIGDYARFLHFYSDGSVNPAEEDAKSAGLSVRCVAR